MRLRTSTAATRAVAQYFSTHMCGTSAPEKDFKNMLRASTAAIRAVAGKYFPTHMCGTSAPEKDFKNMLRHESGHCRHYTITVAE